MLMDKETIINMYKESFEKGDPVKQIKSLAKANNVKATFIKKILSDAGLEVPDHIPTGPIKKDAPEIEAADPVPGEIGYKERKAAVINEDFAAAVDEMTGKRAPLPGVIKEAVCYAMEAMDEQIEKYEQEQEALGKKIAELNEKRRSIMEYIKRPIYE